MPRDHLDVEPHCAFEHGHVARLDLHDLAGFEGIFHRVAIQLTKCYARSGQLLQYKTFTAEHGRSQFAGEKDIQARRFFRRTGRHVCA